MKSKRDAEAPLTPDEVQKILRICSPRGLLVGGQALAFWADHLQVKRPENLVSGVTADADFIGDSALAKDLARRLGWQIWIPALDDSTPRTAKVTHRTKGGEVKQVDFLSGVIGLTTKDLARRAVEAGDSGDRSPASYPPDRCAGQPHPESALAPRQTHGSFGEAMMSFALRGERQPWGAEDTAFVFREIFKAAPENAQQVHGAILAYARKRPPIVNAR